MKIAVAGATGSVGWPVVEVLKARGHEVVPIPDREEGMRIFAADATGAVGRQLGPVCHRFDANREVSTPPTRKVRTWTCHGSIGWHVSCA